MINPKRAGSCTVGSAMEDECSPAVPLKTVLSLAESTSSWKYFIITGHIDDLNESGRAEKAKKDRMTIYCNLEGVRIAGGKGGTVVWNQTVKALCYPSMCLMGSVAERSKALV